MDIRCDCGAVRGTVEAPAWTNRALCYCASCQGFPERLGKAETVLDEHGGTDIVQVPPDAVRFTRGTDRLACLRMTPKGPLRWYATCCKAPIGNTPASPQLSFVGLLHTCLGGHDALDASVGPVQAVVFPEEARGEPKPDKRLPPLLVLRLAMNLARSRLSGRWKRNPFFNDAGTPLTGPTPPNEPLPES